MKTARILFVILIVAALVAGSMALAGKPNRPKPCKYWDLMCLDVWDPVQCDDGVIYSNACYAKRACAKGCVPIGGGPVPL